ncbi:MAG: NAD(P)/FAD-dependent oxidoreductase [bacterium]
MAKIVIIGNSAAGNSCLQSLINSQGNNEITVISQEEGLPYRRDQLLDYISSKVEEKELFLCAEDFYSRNNIAIQKNNPLIRLDAKKQRLVLKDNSKINYDYLIIASGQKLELPDLAGKTKDGVFSLYNLGEAKEIKQRLVISQTVCLVGEAMLCLALASIIAAKDKEVKVISGPQPQGFVALDKAEWIADLSVTEIIGEGSELKALKLSNGKVLAASLIIFCGNYTPSSDFLKETGINLEQGYIIVDDNMRTNLENIFACGSVCNKEGNITKEKSWEQAAQEGSIVAGVLNGLIERGKIPCQQTS